MYLSAEFVNYLEELIPRLTGTHLYLENIIPVRGGDINDAYCIAGRSKYFLKVNCTSRYPKLFLLEREGLKTLKHAGAMVPECLGIGNFHDYSFILLDWIEQEENSSRAQENLGRMLALLHDNTNDRYGLEYDNYLGTWQQSNQPHTSWPDFFIEERLKKQLEWAIKREHISLEMVHQFELLFQKIPDLMPKERPALLHGDLWAGNYIIGANNTPYLIDPAIYYGHREMDIALTQLFGGFTESFYQAYMEIYPLEKGWEERSAIHNLYILLFHANQFGGSYIQQVKSILERYV